MKHSNKKIGQSRTIKGDKNSTQQDKYFNFSYLHEFII